MCGRFAMDKGTDELIAEFTAVGGDFRDWLPGWNIRPTQTIAVVLDSSKGGEETLRRLEPARWSITPGWSKTLATKFSFFNARSEGITEKSTWRSLVKSQRAIVPVTGYYEWQTDPDTKKKTPFYIHPADGELMFLAGLYSWWKDPAKAEDDPDLWTLTATILTSDAVGTLAKIHDRNPVPLPREWVDDWLNPELEGDQSFVDAAVAAAHPVAEALLIRQLAPLNGDGPELTLPVG
jgi:putative SOS response-associated peptidase YedK